MPPGKYDHIKQRTKFCPKGHNKEIVGRNKHGACLKCINESRKKRYIPHPKKITKFCPQGHDKDIVGRNKTGQCMECRKLVQRKDPTKNSLIKQFCPRGHDTFVVGRSGDSGVCKECRKFYTRQKRERIRNGTFRVQPQKPFCKHGHDISVVGRDKWGACNQCTALARNAKRRALRIVAWTDWNKIKSFEHKRPKGMVIDHYIPLQGDEVSGLHVSWNLQYLTRHDNCVKSNNIDLLKASEWYGEILKQAGLK